MEHVPSQHRFDSGLVRCTKKAFRFKSPSVIITINFTLMRWVGANWLFPRSAIPRTWPLLSNCRLCCQSHTVGRPVTGDVVKESLTPIWWRGGSFWAHSPSLSFWRSPPIKHVKTSVGIYPWLNMSDIYPKRHTVSLDRVNKEQVGVVGSSCSRKPKGLIIDSGGWNPETFCLDTRTHTHTHTLTIFQKNLLMDN